MKRIADFLLAIVVAATILPVQVMAEEVPEENELTLEAVEYSVPMLPTIDTASAEGRQTIKEEIRASSLTPVKMDNGQQFTLSSESPQEPESVSMVACGTCGENLTWVLTADGTLTISGAGAMQDYSHGNSDNPPPWYDTRNCILTVTVEDGVTNIGTYSFCDCNNLIQADLGDGIKAIGKNAFDRCSQLVNISIPASTTLIDELAFFECSALTDLLIPTNVKELGDYAFSNCESLQSLICKGNIRKIGADCFSNCSSLTNVTFEGTVRDMGVAAFSGCTALQSIILPDAISSIRFLFQNCTSLERVVLPDGIKEIGYSTFFGCTNLREVNIPESVTTIHFHAFENCKSLKALRLPEGISYIADYAFNGCSNLDSINFPKQLSSIGDYAFAGCNSLQIASLPNRVFRVGEYAFADCTALKTVLVDKQNLDENNTQVIGFGAFDNCASLSDVYYNGSATDWEKITIEDSNDDLVKANIHFDTSALLLTVDNEDATVLLTADEKIYTPTKSNGQYTFENLPAGTYTLRVERDGLISYEENIQFNGTSAGLPSIHLLKAGNINGKDGVDPDVRDVQALYEHLTGTNTLTDAYRMKVADVNGDTCVDVYDLQRLYEAIIEINIF